MANFESAPSRREPSPSASEQKPLPATFEVLRTTPDTLRDEIAAPPVTVKRIRRRAPESALQSIEGVETLGDVLRKVVPNENLPPTLRRTENAVERREVLTFDGIYFEETFDKEGNFLGYRSSALGRKRIALRDSEFANTPSLDLDTGYKVRVVGDSNPNNPEKGLYTVEIVAVTDEERIQHRNAAVERATRLRESTGFQILAKMVNGDPDLSAEYRPFVRRHAEFKDDLQQGEERHRNFTPMLSGLLMSRRGHALLDRVIDRTVSRDSEILKEAIGGAERPVYVPGVVVGGGVYASILASTRQMYLPDCPDLVLDRNKRIGGQFAQYGGDVFGANSRTRPELRDMPHLPGGEQSLNSSGKYAPLHQSDTTGEIYGSQTTMADPARVNLFLSGKAVTQVDVTRLRVNRDGGEGEIVVDFIDTVNKKIFEVATDRVTFASGLGEEVTRLNPDDSETTLITLEEKKRFEETGRARVLSMSQFVEMTGNPETPFPLQGVKKMLLSGSGDSGNVIAGIALGYEGQVGKSVKQLDNIEEFIWLNQPIETKERFLEQARARYAQLGLEFPREQFEGYYARIKAIPNVRANELREGIGGQVRVTLDSGDSFSDRDDDAPEYVDGDLFVYAHGFEDGVESKVASLKNEVVVGQDLYDDIVQLGDTVFLLSGPVKRFEVERAFGANGTGGRNLCSVRTVYRDGRYEDEMVSIRDVDRLYGDELKKANVIRIERPLLSGELELETEVVSGIVRGRSTRLGKRFSDVPGTVLLAGPSSKLPLSDGEKEDSPVLATINENAVGVFRYVDRVEALAERAARDDIKQRKTKSELYIKKPRPEIVLPPQSGLIGLNSFSVDYSNQRFETIGLGESTPDLIKLAVGTALADYVFPKDLSEVRIELTKGAKANEYSATLSPSLPTGYIETLSRMIGDPLVGGVIRRVTDNSRSKSIQLILPITAQKINSLGVRYEIPKK